MSCWVGGSGEGQKGFLQARREIPKGKNELTEHLIGTETEKAKPDLIRLCITRSIYASAVYLAEKNLPYTSRTCKPNAEPTRV